MTDPRQPRQCQMERPAVVIDPPARCHGCNTADALIVGEDDNLYCGMCYDPADENLAGFGG